jgi:hypothetical protein
MDGSLIDIILFAPLALIFGVILFWFIQLLFIESQKYFLSQISQKHDALIRFSNFLGVLFQTICHALGYTVTKSGISSFYVSVNYGRVSPKKVRKGLLEWTSNAFLFIGPFFIPSMLILIFLLFLIRSDSFLIYYTGYTFSDNFISFGINLYNFSSGFIGFLSSIDLLNPLHLGFLILIIVMGMGIRPSFIGEEKQEKVDMIYDLKNIKNNILDKPIYILLLILISYIIFYISILIEKNLFITLFTILGWLSIISIISLVIAHMILLLIKFSDEINGILKLIPYITIPASYLSFRLIFFYFPISNQNNLSLIFTIFITSIVIIILIKKKTNKFKTKIDMDSLLKLGKGRSDEPRRIIRKRTN